MGAQIIFPKSGHGLESRSVQWGTELRGRVGVNGRSSARDNSKCDFNSAQFNISSHYLFMVQKSTHRVAMSYHCYLTVGFCILDNLLWCSTVGYPSDSLASCTYFTYLRIPLANVVGELKPKRTAAKSRGFLVAARLSGYHSHYLILRTKCHRI